MKQWVLNLDDHSLSCEDERARLSPKAARLLAFLIASNGLTVAREDILDHVWQGLHVSPDLVREYVFEIRKTLGDQASAPTYIETVGRKGFRLIGSISLIDREKSNPEEDEATPSQPTERPPTLLKLTCSTDGAAIAHTTSGEGYPLLFSGSWMTHLELDWESPAYGDYIRHLSKRFQVIRYDQRGNGLSQWSDLELSFERMVDDMEAVIDHYGFDQVAILGMSQGASVAVACALRHPEKISHLVLNGGYARGRCQRGDESQVQESEALVTLIKNSWANENPAIRQALTTLFMPEASPEQMHWFNAFQKLCGPAENIATFRALFDDINVVDLLPQLRVPTLVLHSDRDSAAPLSEGKLLAANIPDAAFLQLNSPNHMLFEVEPDFAKMIGSIERFILK